MKCDLKPFLVFLVLLITSGSGQDFWNFLNKFYGGRVNEFAIGDSGIVYAGFNSGVSISYDSGETWNQTSLRNVYIKAVIVDQHNNVFAGSETGIRRSTDHGATWIYVNNGLPVSEFDTRAFALHPAGFIVAATGKYVSYSTNGGTYWIPTNNGLPNSNVTALATNKNGMIFAGTETEGVYRSDNLGTSWNAINNGLGNLQIGALAVTPTNTLFAGTHTGLYRSTDFGNSWVYLNNGIAGVNVYSIATMQDGEIFIATRSGIYHSTDNGDSWANITSSFGNSWYTAITLLGSAPRILTSHESAGVFFSDDLGAHWSEPAIGLIGVPISDITIAANNDMFCVTSENGIYSSTDNGNTWQLLNSTLPYQWSGRLVFNFDSTLFICTQGGLYRSLDNGNTWSLVGLENLRIFDMAHNGVNKIYTATYGGVYTSTDTGNTWQASLTNHFVYSIIYMDNGNLFAGGVHFLGHDIGSGVYRSSNDGQNWSWVGIDYSDITSLVFSPNNNIYAGGWAPVWNNNLFISTDNGNNWYGLGFDQIHIQDILVISNDTLLVGTEEGIYVSNDGGWTWSELNSGLAGDLDIRSLAVNSEGYVFAGASNGAIYRSHEPITAIKPLPERIPERFTLEQNFPNPFNSSTVFQFTIPHRTHVTLKIFNILGQKVVSLIDEELAAGTYSIPWDANGFASGVYYYQLTTEEYSQTRKMVLLK
ncbi:MAG: T9SS C-terminal target domain-containing protein [Calditrichaeota bacterium]|nr:MAG: T9SS C-terminal target domain-containing protein [Calditrichota bacterium]